MISNASRATPSRNERSPPRLTPRAQPHLLEPHMATLLCVRQVRRRRPLLVCRCTGGVRREQRIYRLQGETQTTGIPLTEPGAIVAPSWGTIWADLRTVSSRAPSPSIFPNSFCVYSGVSGLARGSACGPTNRPLSGAPEETVDSVPPPGAENGEPGRTYMRTL